VQFPDRGRAVVTVTTDAAALKDRDWLLFVDFCAAGEREALPASVSTIAEFMYLVPVGESAAGRRQRAIRRAHAAAGQHVVSPFTRRKRREPAPGIGAFPTTRFPVGLRGRRDAFIVLLIGELGFFALLAARPTQYGTGRA
jgi:hypothetical protein